MNALPDVNIIPLKKKIAPLLPEGKVNVHKCKDSKIVEDAN